jgi:hypothetical protein
MKHFMDHSWMAGPKSQMYFSAWKICDQVSCLTSTNDMQPAQPGHTLNYYRPLYLEPPMLKV